MKFIRWLGAFRKSSSSIENAANWEAAQVERQVAAEPIHHGRSLLSQAKIGLIIDYQASRLHAAWLTDAWTEIQADGTLRAKYLPRNRQGKKYRDVNRFLAAWNAIKNPSAHAEAVFDSVVYSGVVVKHNATERGKRRAKRLAEQLNLPLRIL